MAGDYVCLATNTEVFLCLFRQFLVFLLFISSIALLFVTHGNAHPECGYLKRPLRCTASAWSQSALIIDITKRSSDRSPALGTAAAGPIRISADRLISLSACTKYFG